MKEKAGLWGKFLFGIISLIFLILVQELVETKYNSGKITEPVFGPILFPRYSMVMQI